MEGKQVELKAEFVLGLNFEVNPTILKKEREEREMENLLTFEEATQKVSEEVNNSTSSKPLIITDTYNFITSLGILQDGDKLPDDLFVSIQGEGFYKRVPFNSYFLDWVSKNILHNAEVDEKEFRLTRIGLSHHDAEVIQNKKSGEINWITSYSTFKKTKIIAWVDIDTDKGKNGKKVDEIDILITFPATLKKIPEPTVIKRTYKGWHLFWVSDEYFTREEENLLKDVSLYIGQTAKKYLSELFEPSKIEVKSPLLAETRITTKNLYARFDRDRIIPKAEVLNFAKVKHTEIKKQEVHIPETKISKFNLEQVKSVCKVWQQVEDTWDKHHYETWYLACHFYALDFVLNGNEKAKGEFIHKSQAYPEFNYEKAESQWEYAVRWIEERKKDGFGYLFSCETIREKAGYTQGIDLRVCEGCGIRRNPFLELIEEVGLPVGYERKDGWICFRDEENNLIKLVKEFAVVDIYRVITGGKDKTYVKIRNFDNQTFEVEYDYTSSGNLNIGDIRKYLYVNPSASEKKIQKLISSMIEHFKVAKSKINTYSFIGYKSHNNYVIAGRNGITRSDIMKLITHSNLASDEEDLGLTIPIPEVKGNKDAWLTSFKNLHKAKDSVLASIIGFSLLQINKRFFEDLHFTPILLLRAVKGTGKTLRMELASTLFTSMGTFSFISTTKAKILNFFGSYKFPIFFDEVIAKDSDKVKDLRELIYYISNKATKEDAYKTTYPISSPVIFAGETSNLLFDELLTGGITRRVIPLDIDKQKHSTSLKSLIQERRTLRRNYGWIVEYLQNFTLTKLIEDYYEHYLQKIENEKIGYESKYLIASILTNYKIFVEKVLEEKLDSEFEKEIIELLIKGAKSLVRYDEEIEEEERDLLQEVKLIQEQVIKIEQKDKLGTSRHFKNIIKEAKLNFSDTEKDKKKEIAWKLLTGRAYSKGRKYYIESYSPSNLINALLYEYNTYQIEEKINAEINRLKGVVEYLKARDGEKGIFKEVYTELLSEVLEKYNDKKNKIEELREVLKEVYTEEELDIIFNGKDEAVEF